MAVLSLPLTFTNSFWTQDYRKGLEILYSKLEQGVVENNDIVAFIRARAAAEAQIATSLQHPVAIGSHGAGFNRDDGASLLMAFRGLQAESEKQGQVHKDISNDLRALVADPFSEWAQGYEERLSSSKAMVMNNWLRAYEDSQKEVIKLKNSYLQKTHRADEAEDDARFAPNNDLGDHYTSSPRLLPRDKTTHPQRSATVSERIAQRFKEIQRKAAGTSNSGLESDAASETSEEKAFTKVDKGKMKAVESPSPGIMESPPPLLPPLPPAKLETTSPLSMEAPLPPTPILLAGLAIPPATVSTLLLRAATELKPRSIKFPLLGEYPDCFTGEEFVAWLNANIPGFDGNLDRAEDAARELTERDGLLRRIGEFGNEFEHSDEAYYQFRPKAFELGSETEAASSAPKRNLTPLADSLIKRSNNFVNVVTKALNSNAQTEPAHIRLRVEAEEADKIYRVAVRKLDRQRLGLEERIEETLKNLQRGEMERLRAVKTVLLQYQGTLATIPKAFEPSIERSATLVASYQPDADLTALMERYRTGPFRPVPQLYESVAHDESDVVFGIDLRKWAEGGWNALTSGEEKKDLIPPVLTALLNALNETYDRLPNDSEKRKAWIYEVPLPALHHLREALNAVPPGQPFSLEMLTKYDAPVLAGGIKLWALELDPPLALWEGWDDIRKLYPTVGSAKADGDVSEEQHLQDLQVALQRLPKVHLYVLDAIVSHLRNLIESTSVEEPDDTYFTKLALSIGRTIIKPKVETELSIQDRHPTLLFIDLLKNYDDILPPTIARKKRESERRIPIRKRTAPVDMRMSRGRISVGAPSREILAAQQAAQRVAAQVPDATVPERVPEAPRAAVDASPISESKSFDTEPEVSDAVVEEREQFDRTEQSIISPPVVEHDSTPQRPEFKEPPPEFDEPPRPTFKEPPPEIDDIPSPSMQPTSFVSPPASPPPMMDEKAPSPAVSVTPATPHNPIKALRRNSAIRSGSASPARSPSPLASSATPAIPAEDQILSTGRTGLSRHSSGQAAVVRGPRISRGPRTAGGGSVSSMVANLNKSSMSKSPPPSPNYKRLSGGTTRPGSILGAVDGKSKIGRGGAFSRRTMASDAEDEVVDR
ncbi:uncharacterized protein EDB93DRAFT_818604 [Suillus bovinus]|uniref:uncharacterized protein n=1 Tax=Suillus bovinus TaxID=48563 RepID=UPI001B8751AA|nr:uncharacterized protein EDB93DRAFT_818604 [Suillus bovinus]KAG2157826.1 hypothetical protein EDB93DRAFT_818604 [Suillus bovinus]